MGMAGFGAQGSEIVIHEVTVPGTLRSVGDEGIRDEHGREALP
jgi:hypothetical protein